MAKWKNLFYGGQFSKHVETHKYYLPSCLSLVLLVASLASSLSDDLLAKATTAVVQLLKNKNMKPEITRTNIQMVGALR